MDDVIKTLAYSYKIHENKRPIDNLAVQLNWTDELGVSAESFINCTQNNIDIFVGGQFPGSASPYRYTTDLRLSEKLLTKVITA